MQLDSMLVEETMEEVRCQHPKPVLVEVDEQHHFPGLRMRHHLAVKGPPSDNFLRWKKTLHHKALQLHLYYQ